MPAGSCGRLNVPSLDVKVWLASRLVRLRAMTSALPTGRAELVTLPRTWTTEGSGSGLAEKAGRARAPIAVAKTVARSRISALLSLRRVYGHRRREVKRTKGERIVWDSRSGLDCLVLTPSPDAHGVDSSSRAGRSAIPSGSPAGRRA